MQSFHLDIGMEAPHFTLPDADMEPCILTEQLQHEHIVLYFYPSNNSRCSILEASEFSDLTDEFEKLDTVIIGISNEDCLNLADMRDHYGLTVSLLSDPDICVSQRYGVVYPVIMRDGHKKNRIKRSTFILDHQGKLSHVMYDVHAHGHPQEVLNLIKKGKQ